MFINIACFRVSNKTFKKLFHDILISQALDVVYLNVQLVIKFLVPVNKIFNLMSVFV